MEYLEAGADIVVTSSYQVKKKPFLCTNLSDLFIFPFS